MIVLDTNVISELFRRDPDARVASWLESLDDEVAITAVTLAELLAGVRRMPERRRRAELERAVVAAQRSARHAARSVTRSRHSRSSRSSAGDDRTVDGHEWCDICGDRLWVPSHGFDRCLSAT
ncbi:PIN domain-containing protein [Microbacterium sp. No. 7]|uniref:PIN domain-containing protein n=1 Tax=Microbacterium sp. No. 7 TaxID=1714373 RepID=UPI0009EB18A1|nr:PIN domain-containing protein [Microbacterium sp. No. 7]